MPDFENPRGDDVVYIGIVLSFADMYMLGLYGIGCGTWAERNPLTKQQLETNLWRACTISPKLTSLLCCIAVNI